MKKQFLACVAITALAGCNTTNGSGGTKHSSKQGVTTILLEENCKNDDYILIESQYFLGSDILTKYGCKHDTKLTKRVFVDGKMQTIQAPSRDGKTYTKAELDQQVANDPNVGYGEVVSETVRTIQR